MPTPRSLQRSGIGSPKGQFDDGHFPRKQRHQKKRKTMQKKIETSGEKIHNFGAMKLKRTWWIAVVLLTVGTKAAFGQLETNNSSIVTEVLRTPVVGPEPFYRIPAIAYEPPVEPVESSYILFELYPGAARRETTISEIPALTVEGVPEPSALALLAVSAIAGTIAFRRSAKKTRSR